jgi:CheY-like chemotaxis protein
MEALPDYRGRQFLAVDDIPAMLDAIGDILRRCGADDVARAAEPQEAIVKLEALASVDCVISDYNMGPVNGLQLLQAVRMGAVRGIPRDLRFVLVTGHGDLEIVQAAKALDVSAYVVKPMSLANLVKAVDRAFQTRVTLRDVDSYKAVATRARRA